MNNQLELELKLYKMRKFGLKLYFLIYIFVILFCFDIGSIFGRIQGRNVDINSRDIINNNINRKNNIEKLSFVNLSNNYELNNSGSMIVAGHLFATFCFIYCIKGLSCEKTAHKSNIIGFIGMLFAIMVTLSEDGFGNHYVIFFLTVFLSGGIGIYIADSTQLIKMPQLVATFHSFVGLAALFVSYSFFYSHILMRKEISVLRRMEIFFGGAMGMVTFIGSVIAALKLDDILPSRSIKIPFKNKILMMISLLILLTGICFCLTNNEVAITTNMHCGMILSSLFGIFMIISIGGADMPVIISLLNSYSGWSTSIMGFLLDNTLLIISGSLIGSSGAILSYIMCKGMNRDFISVILGGFDQTEDEKKVGNIKYYSTTPQETSNILLSCSKILIVPGYGMAVSKCQNIVSEIIKELDSRGCHIDIGIHPVAGRMPGHMNVLLAEANVPSKFVKDIEIVNSCIEEYDLALVIGANDIVNPASLNPESKISGMPVINVWKSKKIIVSKRSLAYGYACIENELFSLDKTRMLLGDSKRMLGIVNQIIKNNMDFVFRQPSNSQITEECDELIPLISHEVEQNENKIYKTCKKIALIPTVSEEENNILLPVPASYVSKFREKSYDIALSRDILNKYNKDFMQEEYLKNNALIFDTMEELIKESQVIIKIGRPTNQEINYMRQGHVFICNMFISQHQDKENKQDLLLVNLNKKGVTVIALDEIPRTTRAQKMDLRTTMSNISGYRAVIEAMNYLPRISKSISSAAGIVDQSTVFVIGVGVAGLQAITTAKSMGARVYAMDPRLSCKEEAESCGAIFISIPNFDLEGFHLDETSEQYLMKQREIIEKYLKISDVVITSANVPGKSSPMLITEQAVRSMKMGSVIVDLSSDFGGNCQLTQKNKIYLDQQSHVTIIGKTNYIFSMPLQSSELFSNNLLSLLIEMGGTADNFKLDLSNDIIKQMCIAHENKILWKPTSEKNKIKEKSEISFENKLIITLQEENKSKNIEAILDTSKYFNILKYFKKNILFSVVTTLSMLMFILMGLTMSVMQIQNLFSFFMSTLVGYYCVWEVDSKLHTPLMSVTNALSGVIIIGSMVQYGNQVVTYTTLMAVTATFLASINTFGGFWVTNRILKLFN